MDIKVVAVAFLRHCRAERDLSDNTLKAKAIVSLGVV